MTQRIGIFGGSFDPIHYGHLLLAETCREQLRLDRVLMIPAANSPLKPWGPRATGADRAEMLRLAVGGADYLRVDCVELDRGGVSYTIDTVAAIAARDDGAELFLLVGADSVASMADWRSPDQLLNRVRLGVVQREGGAPPDFARTAMLLAAEDRAAFRPILVPMPTIGISSTDIRQRVAQDRSIRFRTPRAVEAYIRARGLYRVSPAEPSESSGAPSGY